MRQLLHKLWICFSLEESRSKHRPWLTALLARRPTKVAAIALANKLARMAWAMMAKGERYKEPAALAA
jgi:transposase